MGFPTQNGGLGGPSYLLMYLLRWDKFSQQWRILKSIWSMTIISYNNRYTVADDSRIVIIYLKRRRSKILKVSLDRIFSPYNLSGTIMEFNSLSGEETSMRYTIMYTSMHLQISRLTTIATLFPRTSSDCFYPTTCRLTLIFCTADWKLQELRRPYCNLVSCRTGM